jgi:hypothetical protein
MSKKFNVSVLLPTRGRTEALTRSVVSLINRVKDADKIEILVAFDNDDEIGKNHWVNEVKPILDNKKIHYSVFSCNPIGYIRLNEYVNMLAKKAQGSWLMFWNDDAMMQTQNWDSIIMSYEGQFKCLAVHTHREHPYSIFPIVPAEWLDLFGYLSPHQLSDAWISQVSYMLDIWQRIPVWVEHDRYDLTGNNLDDTFKNRPQLENQPDNPEDFHSQKWHLHRCNDCEKLSAYLKVKGVDQTWWENVKSGKQNPWEKLEANDINRQMTQSRSDHAYPA